MTKYAFLAGAALALISTQASAGILGGSTISPTWTVGGTGRGSRGRTEGQCF